jgi:hypothetical protein
MKMLLIKKGFIALVDDKDYPKVSQYKWGIVNGRAAIKIAGRLIQMPYLILGLTPERNRYIDHANNDPLDNRRSNLRRCTAQQNCWNKPPQKRNKTGLKGVSPIGNKWSAQIGGRTLGYFDAPEDAGRAYDRAARISYGRFAWTNFPTQTEADRRVVISR